MGLHRAFPEAEIIGVDIKPQKNYPFHFVQADAMEYPLEGFDFIWASPPCQAFSRVWRGQPEKRKNYPDLIESTRERLERSGAFWVIENVPEAPIRPDVLLTGAMFQLPIVRTRIFEICGFTVPFSLIPLHTGTVTKGDLACVAGNGVNNAYSLRRSHGLYKWSDLPKDLREKLSKRNSADGWREAMGIDWMTKAELAQAVPPAYSEFIGRQLARQIQRKEPQS